MSLSPTPEKSLCFSIKNASSVLHCDCKLIWHATNRSRIPSLFWSTISVQSSNPHKFIASTFSCCDAAPVGQCFLFSVLGICPGLAQDPNLDASIRQFLSPALPQCHHLVQLLWTSQLPFRWEPFPSPPPFLYSSSFWQGLGTDSFWQGAMTVSLWQGSAWATWAAPPPVRAGGRGWGGFCLLLVSFFITSTQHLLLLLEFFFTVLFSAFWQRLHPAPFCVLEMASSSSLLLERASSSSFWLLLATASSSSFRLGKSFTLAFPSGKGFLLFFFLPFGKGFLFFLFLLFALFLFFRSFFLPRHHSFAARGFLSLWHFFFFVLLLDAIFLLVAQSATASRPVLVLFLDPQAQPSLLIPFDKDPFLSPFPFFLLFFHPPLPFAKGYPFWLGIPFDSGYFCFCPVSGFVALTMEKRKKHEFELMFSANKMFTCQSPCKTNQTCQHAKQTSTPANMDTSLHVILVIYLKYPLGGSLQKSSIFTWNPILRPYILNPMFWWPPKNDADLGKNASSVKNIPEDPKISLYIYFSYMYNIYIYIHQK